MHVVLCALHWQLFMKATRLEQISRDYVRAREDQGIMTESIKRNKAVRESAVCV